MPVPFDSLYDEITVPLPELQSLDDIKRLPLPLRLLILRGRPVYDLDRERLKWMYRSYYRS